jgi:GNAT superfamily N-acetyltransferase
MAASPFRWRPANTGTAAIEALFREREDFCAAACSHFRAPARGDRLWALVDRRFRDAAPRALLLCHNRMLFPVLGESLSASGAEVPAPSFLGRLANRISLHAIHGPAGDTAFLVTALDRIGMRVWDEFTYDLFNLDGPPAQAAREAGPANLRVARPGLEHLDELYHLQAAYEKEEVLPRGAIFNAAACRLHLQRLLAEEYILAAWLDGAMAGKINTNAETWKRRQIGGVYVSPAFRGRGIARRLTAEIAVEIARGGKASTLFVKKRNAAARAAYTAAGFVKAGDYRICYY